MMLTKRILRTLLLNSLALVILGMIVAIYVNRSVFEEISDRRWESQATSAKAVILRHYQYGDLVGLRTSMADLARVGDWTRGTYRDLNGELIWEFSRDPRGGRELPSMLQLLLPGRERTVNVTTEKGDSFGVLQADAPMGVSASQALRLFLSLFTPLVGFWALSLAATFFLFRRATAPLAGLTQELLAQAAELNLKVEVASADDEIEQIGRLFVELRSRWKDSLKRALENEGLAAQARMAAQVSHDIRSPLSALNMVVSSFTEGDEEKRALVRNATQRINDIANSLLRQSKSMQSIGAGSLRQEQAIMLAALVDSIASEKRTECRKLRDTHVVENLARAYGIFVNVDATELGRALSNLMNNALDSLSEAGGSVTVTVDRMDNGFASIIISDTGKGMSTETLSKLGQHGYTFGKGDRGNGLGFYHASRTIAEARGTISVESQLGGGTTILVTLPIAPPPPWFIESINIEPGTTIITIDDDPTIHQLWARRLISAIPSNTYTHLTFQTISSFAEWLASNHDTCFTALMDYEFLGSKENGIEGIRRLQVEKNAVLVTSRFDDPEVQAEALKSDIKILPKSAAVFVRLELNEPSLKLDAVLLDDDFLVRSSWEFEAKRLNKTIRTFESEDRFLREAKNFDRATPLFIDVSLGNGVRGEAVAERAIKSGFTDVSLATGYDASAIVPPRGLRAIRGKEPRFAYTASN